MKNFKLLVFVLVGSFVLVTFIQGCKSKKELSVKKQGETSIEVYCSGPDYFSDKDHLRSNSIGESIDQVMSKKKALSNARAELASSVQTMVKGVINNYFSSSEYNNREELEEKYEGMTQEIIKQKIQITKTICEKQTKTAKGTYKTYIAIELDGEELLSSINDGLSKNERLKIDYDYEKFKKIFNEEMEKLGKERGY